MSYSPNVPLAKHKAGLLLSLVLAAISLSFFSPLMVWVVLLSVCAAVVRVSLFLGWYPQPPASRTVNLLAVLSLLALGWFSLSLGLLISMINLLVTACSLKLMVMRNQRDLLQLFLCILFLCGCGYIFEQGMLFVALYSAMVIVAFTALALQYASNQSYTYQLKMLGNMSLQAFPIAAVLFIIFPQLPPLWQMPSTQSASTGISDTMRPGDIASLSQSSELAFRARFEGKVPPPQDRYWRALVLEYFDGEEWTMSARRKAAEGQRKLQDRPFRPQVIGEALQYRVFAEASRQQWLFTLDVPVPGSPITSEKVWQSTSYTFIANQNLMSAMAYDVMSYPSTLLNQTNSRTDSYLNRQVPQDGNPRTREWAALLSQQYPDPKQRLNAVLDYFKQQNFSYTLNPPLMQSDGIDRFLFDAQTGFCAHYASATAFIMRLTGIPARVVAGYQGGEQLSNKVLSVYQYDAHAWIEVWFDEKGWQRIDPTAVVAPNRINFGLEQALEDSTEFLANEPLSLRRLQHLPFFSTLRDYLNQMDYLWSHWVLGFDQKQQQNLFKSLIGEITFERMVYLMVGAMLLISLLLAAYFVPRTLRPKKPKHLHCYQRAVGYVEKATNTQRNNEAPQHYLASVKNKMGKDAYTLFDLITRAFIRMEYAQGGLEKGNTSKMKHHLNRLKRTL
ncbi:transglutaminaseTgpA domain-containing protein [Alteromonas sediminis]|nr:DUF3488 and transglutaminase-like domain-containing protein [Alteromonas sediminis]